MSLLVATNLVDRIYMCADTRLSRVKELNGVHSYEKIHDNQLKLSHIEQTNISLGCVGSPAMGAFLVAKIERLEPKITYVCDLYTYLSENESLILQWIDEFLCLEPVTEYKYGKCVLVFAGQDPRRKRKVLKKQLHELVISYQKASQDKLDNLFEGKPLDQLSKNELSRLTHEIQQHQMGLKHVVFEAITGNQVPSKFIELKNAPDQHLFAMEVNAENAYKEGQPIVKLVNYEWGETAVYGAGYNSAILEPTSFGYMDLHMQSGEDKRDMIPMFQTVRDKFEDTIGGSITNQVIFNGQIYVMTGYMARISPDDLKNADMLYYLEGDTEGNLYHTVDGVKRKLIPFTDATKEGVANWNLAF